jgi:hypothetical protein
VGGQRIHLAVVSQRIVAGLLNGARVADLPKPRMSEKEGVTPLEVDGARVTADKAVFLRVGVPS